jgi:hypothetical protein
MSLRGIVSRRSKQSKTERPTFEDLRLLIMSNWKDFESVFQGSREAVSEKLERLRNIRNNVCHFQGPLTVDDLNELKDSRRWLERLE